ncbi:MAG: hypothetical protein ABL903_17110 [Methylococcales bacterium]
MLDENLDDIDYGNMDDLPLSDHVEWHYSMAEEVAEESCYDIEWLAA